uniref:Uncharacterized protein n=1 Tax=Candidatus Kentrum sp. LFY TaxID=2126342 RepID=A0A450WVI9_9GAMM|nr:MAG: hypothetical protein BECKLFY1418C_GA0070996_10832 [Candidatus Kentron sp. LFY]
MGLNSWYNFESVVQIDLNVSPSLLSISLIPKEKWRPRRFELPTAWFVDCLAVCHIPSIYQCLGNDELHHVFTRYARISRVMGR